jgi:hydroxymethylbilane synthase
MSQSKTILIATRNSQLALWQANWVGSRLCALHANLSYKLIKITTSADKHSLPLSVSGGKGQFVKAIQAAVLLGQADIAVHSAKDLPCVTSEGLQLAAVPKRSWVNDVLIANSSLQELPMGAKIATGSLRRIAQLKLLRPDLVFEPIRGNVPTRLEQWQAGRYQALVLAQAGLDRLGLMAADFEVIATDIVVPAAGQGALAIECRSSDSELASRLAGLNDSFSHAALIAERACLFKLGGHCFAPIGAYARVEAGRLVLNAVVAGDELLAAGFSGDITAPEKLGHAVADELNRQGAQAIITAGLHSEK